MKNADQWQPTKVERHRGRWRGSRNPQHLAVYSRAIGDWTTEAYERELTKHARGVLADVACGAVPYFGIYGPLVEDTITIDWAAGLHGSKHVDVQSDLNTSIDIPDESADTVLFTDALQYIFNLKLFWSELYRITRFGGKVIVGVPFYYWITEKPYDYHRVTREGLCRYATESGFAIDTIYSVGGLPHIAIDLFCKGSAKLPWLSDLIYALGAALLSIPPVKRAAARSAELFPLSYVMVVSKPPR